MTRLLYVDANASFINPTRNLLPVALMVSADVTCFGPGYVSSDVLARGLSAFIDAKGPFDLAASNTLVLFSDMTDPARYAETVKRAYAYDGAADDLHYLPVLAQQFAALEMPRIAILLENDFYNWTSRERDLVESRADFFIGFGEEMSPRLAAMPYVKMERFASSATDIWADFARRHASRIASLPHFVSDSEFSITPLNARRNQWSIMGVQYHARGVARDALRAIAVEPVMDTRFRRVLSLVRKLRLVRGAKRMVQRFLTQDFGDRIASTRYSYTCGSGLLMPIRQFFAIPAAGAVLVCRPFHGFSALGFEDGVNCIVSEPERIADAHQRLAYDPDLAQRVATAGQKLVFERHSLAARARNLAEIVTAIASKTFKGSEWVGGHHRLRAQEERAN